MNIGILIHSQTGNTRMVAQNLSEKLKAAGHTVSILSVSASNDGEADASKIMLTEKPDASPYDVLFFGAPVRGFMLSPVMQAYISGLKSLQGKKAGCFMTHFFPFAWMGGNSAMNQLLKALQEKGAAVQDTAIVHWSKAATRQAQIEAAAAKLSAGLGQQPKK